MNERVLACCLRGQYSLFSDESQNDKQYRHIEGCLDIHSSIVTIQESFTKPIKEHLSMTGAIYR